MAAAPQASFTGLRYQDEYLGPVTFGPFAEELLRHLPSVPRAACWKSPAALTP